MRSLLVAPSQAGTASVVLLAHRVAAQILPVVAEIEQGVTIGLLLTCGGRDVASIGSCGGEAANATWIIALLLAAVPHERVVVGIELELLGQLLLGHVKPLVVHACGLVVAVAAQVSWQMVTKIDDLSHILHLVAESLRSCTVVDQMQSASRGPEAADATRQILILWR